MRKLVPYGLAAIAVIAMFCYRHRRGGDEASRGGGNTVAPVTRSHGGDALDGQTRADSSPRRASVLDSLMSQIRVAASREPRIVRSVSAQDLPEDSDEDDRSYSPEMQEMMDRAAAFWVGPVEKRVRACFQGLGVSGVVEFKTTFVKSKDGQWVVDASVQPSGVEVFESTLPEEVDQAALRCMTEALDGLSWEPAPMQELVKTHTGFHRWSIP